MVGRSATPLLSLDAAVIDTETTGLDPRNARIVEMAAVRLAGGRLDEGRTFRRLVRPDGAIPAQATRIHGIDAAAVADAPRFAEAFPAFHDFVGELVVIGHSVGFDLAVIGGECGRTGVAWTVPPALDTELLARAVEPSLADFSLDSLAAWLGVEITARHSALGDAIAAAKIFCALVPKLRDAGIRTLAEATRACHALYEALEQRQRAGWREAVPVWRQPGADGSGPGPDTNPYRHRASAIMSSPPRAVGPDMRLEAALKRMVDERISSLLISDGGEPGMPADTGIVTERDVLRAVSAGGAAALDVPVREVMSKPLVTVPDDALAYVAIGRMNRLHIRHLGVTDGSGRVAGVLTARGLLKLRGQGAIELGDELASATNVHDLAHSWVKLTKVAADLAADGMGAREIAAVISQNVVEMTRRAAELAESAMRDAGEGGPPCAYALAVLGSAGRGESLLAMDQDNALIYADDAPAEADRWFERLASRVNDILHEAGIPYCKGGVMAKNAPWRGSQAQWRERIDSWVRRSNPQDLMSVDIFFDLRVAHGDVALGEQLWRHAFDAARGRPEFAKLLVADIGAMPSGRNWFGGFRTEQGRVDLKMTGLFGIVSLARALAICHHVVERPTPARLAGLIERKLGLGSDLEALAEAQGVLLDLILDQQLDDIRHGRPPANTVEVKRLSRRARARLRDALQACENLDVMARDLLFAK